MQLTNALSMTRVDDMRTGSVSTEAGGGDIGHADKERATVVQLSSDREEEEEKKVPILG